MQTQVAQQQYTDYFPYPSAGGNDFKQRVGLFFLASYTVLATDLNYLKNRTPCTTLFTSS